MLEPPASRPRKGRGAVSNRSGRFERLSREAFDDGWPHGTETEEASLPPLATVIGEDRSRSVIARNDSPDIPFDRSINPYRGCEHGCVYCFARPTHAYLGLSPGLDFERHLFVKKKAARLLARELAKPGYRPAVLVLGANTDPYQPIERRFEITRQLLKVLSDSRHPVVVVTKSGLVARDRDLLARMARDGLVRVCLSITSLNGDLARRLEPRAPTPRRRLGALRALSEAGIPVGVLTAPMIPGLNDHEMEAILEEAAQAGADVAGYTLLRLPLELKELFAEWLDAHAPDRKSRVLRLIRETRGGRLNSAQWGERFSGRGIYADLIRQRFAKATRRLGLSRTNWQLDSSRFAPPPPEPLDRRQLSLF